MKYKVKWKIEGEYTVSSSDLDLTDEEASLEGAKEVIAYDPYEGIDINDKASKLTYEVEEV